MLPRDETQIHARAFQGPIVRAFEPMEELRRWLGGELRLNIITRSRRRGRDGKAIVVSLPVAYSYVPCRNTATKRRRNGDISSEGEKTPRGVVTDCARFPAAVARGGCDWLGKRSGSGQLAVDKRPQTAMSKQPGCLDCLHVDRRVRSAVHRPSIGRSRDHRRR